MGVRRRRATAALAAALAGATVLAACGGGAKPTPVATKTVQSGPHVLTFQVFGPAPVVTAYTRIAADFTANHPGVVIDVRPYANDTESREALGKKDADIFLAQRSDLGALTEAKAIRRVDDLLQERNVDFGDGFQREALEAFSGDDSLLCMPTDTSPLVIYYNTRLVHLNRLTQPGDTPVTPDTGWTLQQFRLAAQQASHGRVRGLYIAPSLDELAPFIWSGGGGVVDDPTNPTTLTLGDSSSQSALEQVLELVRDPSITFSDQQLRRTTALKLFKAGRLAMLPGERSLTPTLRAQPNLPFDVMPMPRISHRATSGSMSGLCISSHSKYADDAADFIAYAVSEDPSALLARTGYVTPTNLDTANSDAFLQPGRRPVHSEVFPGSIRYLHRLPSGPAWDEVRATTSRLLNRLFFDPVIDPLEDRLTEIDDTSAAIFARYAPTASPAPSPSPSS